MIVVIVVVVSMAGNVAYTSVDVNASKQLYIRVFDSELYRRKTNNNSGNDNDDCD